MLLSTGAAAPEIVAIPFIEFKAVWTKPLIAKFQGVSPRTIFVCAELISKKSAKHKLNLA